MYRESNVRAQLFDSLSKLFQCGNIQYALVSENGNQFLYEFPLTGEMLELPFSSVSLQKKKKKLLNVLFNMAIASFWLFKKNPTNLPTSSNSQSSKLDFHFLLTSYINFLVQDKQIVSKKGIFLILRFLQF